MNPFLATAEHYLLDLAAGAWDTWRRQPTGVHPPDTSEIWHQIRLLRVAQQHGLRYMPQRHITTIVGLLS